MSHGGILPKDFLKIGQFFYYKIFHQKWLYNYANFGRYGRKLLWRSLEKLYQRVASLISAMVFMVPLKSRPNKANYF